MPFDPDPLGAAKAEAKAGHGGGGGGNGTRPLLALVLPSTVEWPARLDVAVAALVALETSSVGLGGPFDVVVVLDSEVRGHSLRARVSVHIIFEAVPASD